MPNAWLIANGELAKIASDIGNMLHGESEIGEASSMQLQMLMDARSKLLETASDIEKTTSDTDAAMVGNLK